MRTTLVLLLSFALLCSASSSLLRQTTNGPVQGHYTDTNQRWLGIPFAAPPVGNLRWQPPRTPTAWTTPFVASAFGKVCIQTQVQTPAPPPQDEDCLTINVFAPKNANPSSNLPVYVYQYGGQWRFGYSGKYEGSYLAGQDIVVVTFNYRTAALGFMAHPLLLAHSGADNTTGMYGIQDQRAALQWVHDNIANFGGNPNKVTYGGQSAGGGTLCVHLASPKSAGLFHAAIMQSPSCAVLNTREQGFTNAINTVTQLGCTGTDAEILACMLAIPADQLIDTVISHGSMVNDYEIMQRPVDIFKSGDFTPVPLLTGNCWNESSASQCAARASLTPTGYTALLQSTFPTQWEEYEETYPLSKYPTPAAAWITIQSDINFKCTTKAVWDAYSSHYPNVYAYSFEQPIGNPGLVNGPRDCFGTAHGFDTYFLFPSYIAAFQGNFTPAEQAFAEKARNVWVGFIKTHVPVIPGYQQWPKYTFQNGHYVALTDVVGSHVEINYKQNECPLQGVPSPVCSATVSLIARPGNSWVANGVNNQVYDVKISNNGDKKITTMKVNINTGSASITQSWNLNKVGATVYTIPEWYQGFVVGGSSTDAGFILSGAGALTPTVSVNTITC